MRLCACIYFVRSLGVLGFCVTYYIHKLHILIKGVSMCNIIFLKANLSDVKFPNYW